MRRIAIIPARGGSKRVSRKNIVEICGRPTLSYAVECARRSELFEEVYVSTDDAEIARVAEEWHAAVIDRPSRIAQDRSTVVEVCLHALDEISGRDGSIEGFCCIYPTAIFITPEDLRASLVMLDEEPQADVVMAVSPFDFHPVQALRQNGGFWTQMWPEFHNIQSQFYPYLVASNGTLYWARSSVFRFERTFYVKRLKCYEMSPLRVVDIDTLEDLERARRMMKLHLSERTK